MSWQRNRGSQQQSSEPESRELLAEFPIGRDMCRVNRAAFNGKDTIDVRRWYYGDDDQWHPGKGLNMPIEKWPAFVEAIGTAADKLSEGNTTSPEKGKKGSSKGAIDLTNV